MDPWTPEITSLHFAILLLACIMSSLCCLSFEHRLLPLWSWMKVERNRSADTADVLWQRKYFWMVQMVGLNSPFPQSVVDTIRGSCVKTPSPAHHSRQDSPGLRLLSYLPYLSTSISPSGSLPALPVLYCTAATLCCWNETSIFPPLIRIIILLYRPSPALSLPDFPFIFFF